MTGRTSEVLHREVQPAVQALEWHSTGRRQNENNVNALRQLPAQLPQQQSGKQATGYEREELLSWRYLQGSSRV